MDDYELHHLVYDDTLAMWSELQEADSPRARRSYVRTVLAAIEALTFMLKQKSVESTKSLPRRYTRAEAAMLRDETYAVNGKGDAYAVAKFTPTPESFRFAVKMLTKGFGSGTAIDSSSPGWAALKHAAGVRNRLVHPKAADDLAVSDEELRNVHDAFFWVNDVTMRSLIDAVELLQSALGREFMPDLQEVKARWSVIADARNQGT